MTSFNELYRKAGRYQTKIRSRQSRTEIQYNDPKKTDKGANNDLQNTTQKTKD
jgi:hypothetical protein